jgi:hypothetical protein
MSLGKSHMTGFHEDDEDGLPDIVSLISGAHGFCGVFPGGWVNRYSVCSGNLVPQANHPNAKLPSSDQAVRSRIVCTPQESGGSAASGNRFHQPHTRVFSLGEWANSVVYACADLQPSHPGLPLKPVLTLRLVEMKQQTSGGRPLATKRLERFNL